MADDIWKTVAGYAAEDVIKLRRALVWAHERLTTDCFGEVDTDVTNTADGIERTLLGMKSPASEYAPDPEIDVDSYRLFIGDRDHDGLTHDD